jgi:tellurite resistance protein TerC
LTVPVWVWAATAAGLLAIAATEGWLASRSGGTAITARWALRWVVAYVSLAVIFGLGIAVAAGATPAGQFYAGYLTEYSLSLDNLFIFYVIMSQLAVPPARQHRVLLLGIGLALVLRTVLIVVGVAIISRFGWLFYPLGGLLLWTAAGLIRSKPDQAAEQHTALLTWLRSRARQAGTTRPMLLVVLAIGVADVMFAFDSIPAIFGITTSAYLIVTGNALALMGLRQAYVLLARVLDRLVYLTKGLAVICSFIGVKLLLQALRSSGVRWAVVIPAWLSITVVVGVLAVSVLAGARHGRPALTVAERAVLGRRFAVIDTDGNGVWQRADCDQLTRRLCDTFGHAVDSGSGRAIATGLRTLFDAMLRHMDANGDQEITQEEFADSFGRPMVDRTGFDVAVSAAAHALVRVADRDGNQVLDPREYAELAGVYGASADEAARAFGRIDTDRNGVLDDAELTEAISQFFASRDAEAAGNLAFGRL